MQSIDVPGGAVDLSDILLTDEDHKSKHGNDKTFKRMNFPLQAYDDSIATDANNAVRAKAKRLWMAKIELQRLIKTVERFGHDQGTWRCDGGGDSVNRDGGGCTAEDSPPLPCRSLFTLELELMGAEGRLPRGPRLVGAGEAVPVRALLHEASRDEERASGDIG